MLSSKNVKKLNVALVHDFLSVEGGAEKALIALHEIWPESPVYTANYFPERFGQPISTWDIRTSFVSRFPFQNTFEDQYKLFYQLAMEQFDFSGYDLVMSVTYAGYAKGIITRPETKHFSYVCTVPRYLWGLPTAKHGSFGFFWKKVIMPPLEHRWRMWDRITAERPDKLIAISDVIRERVNKYYRIDPAVIYPPVDISAFENIKPEQKGYFVHWGRLEEYKRIDMIIEACIKAKKKLKIIGDGNISDKLKILAASKSGPKYVEFLGRLNDAKRNEIITGADGVIFACPDEDFGIVPVEAMAAGKPVIAFNMGGVTETVIDGKTGVLVKEFSVEALADALKTFKASKFKVDACREQARKFSKETFKQNIIDFVIQNYDS